MELLRALVDRGDVELVGVAAAHRNPPADAFIPPVSIRSLPLPRRALYESWQWLRRPRVERATGPVDVVHDAGYVVPPSTAPLVATVHDLLFLEYPEHYTWHSRAVLRRGLTLARRDARVVICPSRATIDACRAAGFEDERLRLVPWGVRHRTVEEGAAERTRRRYGLAGPYVLFCGTVEPRKNLPRVLERSGGSISPTWNSSSRPTGLAGGLADGAADLAGRVRALGFVPPDDLLALYGGGDARLSEPRGGFGLPVLEAMAQGVPVVTSAGTATAEVAGEAAVLVDPLDVDAIAGGIDRILGDETLAASLGEAARMRAAGYVGTHRRARRRRLRGSRGVRVVTRPRVGINLLWLIPEEAGGSEVYAVRILRALHDVARDVVDLTLLCNRRFPDAYPELVERFPIAVAPIDGGSRAARIAAESTWLPGAASREQLHLVHHLNHVIPWIRNRRSVLTIHDLRPIELPDTVGRIHGAYLRARLRPSARKAAVITTPSEYVRGTVIERLGPDPDRVRVVSAPLVPVVVRTEPTATVPPGGATFLYPAITNRHKNHGTLLEAFARVVADGTDAHLVLTGAAGEAEDDVRRTIASLGLASRVRRAGRISTGDSPLVVRCRDGPRLSIDLRGFGLPLAEAMAAGCPVIASDRTALPEVVGDAGILVDALDVEGWADAMTGSRPTRTSARRTSRPDANAPRSGRPRKPPDGRWPRTATRSTPECARRPGSRRRCPRRRPGRMRASGTTTARRSRPGRRGRVRGDHREVREVRGDDLRLRARLRSMDDRGSALTERHRRPGTDPGGHVEAGAREQAQDVRRPATRGIVHDDDLRVRLGRRCVHELRAGCPEGPAPADRVEDLLRRRVDAEHRFPVDRGRRPRYRPELHRPRRQATELSDEVDQVARPQPLIAMERGQDGAHERRSARDHARSQHLVDHGSEELLLPADPREVGDVVAGEVSGPDVRERLVAVEALATGLDHERRVRVGDVAGFVHVDLGRRPIRPCRRQVPRRVDLVRRDAQVHTAQRVHDPLEPVEVDVQVVVDREAREVRHGLRDALGPTTAQTALERGVDAIVAASGSPPTDRAGTRPRWPCGGSDPCGRA